jgi:hypothetical protein
LEGDRTERDRDLDLDTGVADRGDRGDRERDRGERLRADLLRERLHIVTPYKIRSTAKRVEENACSQSCKAKQQLVDSTSPLQYGIPQRFAEGKKIINCQNKLLCHK